MGKRGPRPTPTKELEARGSWRAKTRPDEPDLQPLTEVPCCPMWIRRDGRELWKKLAPVLVAGKVLTAADLAGLEAMCSSYGDWRETERLKQKEGRLATGEKGGVYTHPAVNQASEACKRFMKAAADFGATPAARTRIAVDKSPGKDTANAGKERFFKRHG